jgi:hypothetical protein
MIMKRTALIIGFGVLLLGLALAQPGVGQMGGPAPVQSPPQNQQAGNPAMGSMAMAQAKSPQQLQMEIHLLRAIDMAGLGKAQLTQLKAIVGNLKGARDALSQANQQLRDFLLSFQGTPADFAKAVVPYDQKVQASQKALHDAIGSAVQQVKGMLTISQGEALCEALMPMRHRMMGWDDAESMPMMQIDPMMQQMQEKMQAMMQAMQSMAGMKGMMGMMGNPAMGPMQQMMERMRRMMEERFAPERMPWGQMLLEHLDLIDQVLTEKLANMKG